MLTVFLFCCSGFAALSLAMDRHAADAVGASWLPERRRPLVMLRAIGAVALAWGWWAAASRTGGAMGTTLWAVQLSLGALAVTALLTWAPRRVPRLALLCGACAVLLWITGS